MRYARYFAIAAMFAAVVASAQPAPVPDKCDEARKNVTGLPNLQKLFQNQCLGDDKDKDGLTKEVNEKLYVPSEAKATPANRVETVRALLPKIREHLEGASRRLTLPPGVTRHPLQVIRTQVMTAGDLLQQGSEVAQLTVAHWELDIDNGKLGGIYHLGDDLLSPACKKPVETEDCAKALSLSEEAVRVALLMQKISQYLALVQPARFFDELRIFDEQWRQYATMARSQTLIELSLNSAVFDRKQDVYGFVAPPDYQYIILHPSVAMEYVSAASAGSRFQPSVIMEWFGYNKWTWQTSGGSVKMARPLGISLVSSFSDRAGTTAAGHGLMVHYDHVYSLGITRHGDDVGVFLSVDLQKMVMDKSAQLQSVKEKFGLAR